MTTTTPTADATTTTEAPATTQVTTTTEAITTTTEGGIPLDPDLLEGSWLVGGPEGVVMTFRANATHAVSYRNLVSFEEGTVDIEGDVETFVTTEGRDLVCRVGDSGSYRFRMSEDGMSIDVTFVSDTCGKRTTLVNGLTRYDP